MLLQLYLAVLEFQREDDHMVRIIQALRASVGYRKAETQEGGEHQEEEASAVNPV